MSAIIAMDEFDDGETFGWVVILQGLWDGEDPESKALTECYKMTDCGHPVTPHSEYTPTGKPFWREPWVRIYGNTAIITQDGGLDI